MEVETIQNTSRLPEKQRKIADYVLRYMKQNKLHEDAILPSENALAKQFGVNRNVVRMALGHLRAQGHIYSIKGKGFFMAKRIKPLIYKHSATIGFSEIVGREFEDYHSVNQIFSDYYGYDKPSCDNITIEAVPAQAELLKYFDIPEGIPILSINCSFSTEKTGPIEYFMIKARSDIFKFTMDFNENR